MLSIFSEHATLQTFKDNSKAKGYAAIKHGTLADLEPWAKAENGKGLGVYIAVNQTDGGGRKAENVNRIRAYICDVDGLANEAHKKQKTYELLSSELPPSAVVFSGNGIHAYWYAEEGQPLNAQAYSDTNMGIIQRFGGCTQTKDIARVLRLPGYLHLKDPAKPYMIHVAFEDPNLTYTAEQVRRAYPHTKPKPTYRAAPPISSGNSKGAWGEVVTAIQNWTPQDGIKHKVVVLAMGVGGKFGVPENEVINDLIAVTSHWDMKHDPSEKFRQDARFAYQNPATVSGLRSLGVDVPNLGTYL